MPDIVAHSGIAFVSIPLVTKRLDGTLVTPDADPLCEIFRVDPATGIMVKDLAMGTLGEVSLTLTAGSSFLYGAPLELAPAAFEQYNLTITFSYDSGAGTNVEHVSLLLSLPGTVVYNSRNVTTGSVGTTFKAPPV